MKFLILNGPNVNLQRYSEPGMPGELDYNGMMDYVQSGCDQMGIETDVCQTNHEGDLIDEIQAAAGRVDGIVLNPGGYAHTSVAILDALRLLAAGGEDFRMVFIGGGADAAEVQEYAKPLGNKCIFTGAISQRETLRA